MTKAKSKSAAKRGRPKLPEGEAKPTVLTVRITKGLREQLEAAASESGRSMAQEAMHRVEQSFRDERTIEVMFGEDRLQALFQTMASFAVLFEKTTGAKWDNSWESCAAMRTIWDMALDLMMQEHAEHLLEIRNQLSMDEEGYSHPETVPLGVAAWAYNNQGGTGSGKLVKALTEALLPMKKEGS